MSSEGNGNDRTVIVSSDGRGCWTSITVAIIGAAAVIIGAILTDPILRCQIFGLWCPPPGQEEEVTVVDSLPVEISVYSSDTKEDWLDAVVKRFSAAGITTAAGNPIQVNVHHVKSGSSKDAIVAGEMTPTAWSPGDQSWVETLNQEWEDLNGRPLITEACQPTVRAPVGFAMFDLMAKALGWPDKPIPWSVIVDLAADPQGWAKYGHPEWGAFKFGHTHPALSNSGLLILTDLAYSVLGDELTAELIRSDAFTSAMRAVELNTWHYGRNSGNIIERMVTQGPAYLHATNATEAEVLKANRGDYGEPRYPLVFVAPAGGMVWPEHPYCVLDADWSSDEQKEAARIFGAYLTQPAQQALAPQNLVRPIDSTIPLTEPFTLENGTVPSISPETIPALPGPSSEVSAALADAFLQTKKKATVVLVLDTSQSMADGNRIKDATQASADFVEQLQRDDAIYAYIFNDTVIPLSPAGRAGDVKEELKPIILGLWAEGNTALYDAVCVAVQKAEALKSEDEAVDQRRLYAVVVLSDGADTDSERTENDMLACLPQGESGEGIKVFTIAYGDEADREVLTKIANRTNAKTYSVPPDTIENVYLDIAVQQ